MADLLVSVDRTLKKDIEIKKLISILEEKFKEIPDIQSHKLENSITQLVCNIVENYCKAKKYKIDKKQVVIEFLVKLHSLGIEDICKLDKQIEYLHTNKLISKIPMLKYVKHNVLWFLKKKLL